MTTRTISDATVDQLNAIVNRPDVWPKIGGKGEHLDIRNIDCWDRTIALTCGDGCMLFVEEPDKPGIYRIDFLMIPSHRDNLVDARAMVSYMIRERYARGFWGPISQQNTAALRFADRLPAELVAENAREKTFVIHRDRWPH